jgi:hypothetical protein
LRTDHREFVVRVLAGTLGSSIVLMSACAERTPLESGASTIVVHAVLNGAVRNQYVVVQRTVNGVPAATAVAGATVTITAPGGLVMTATEDHDSSIVRVAAGDPTIALVYQVSLDQYNTNLVPGGTYQLHVRMPTGEDVTGSTTIPDAAPVGAAAGPQNFDPARDTLRLAWGAVSGARSYEVLVESSAGAYALFADSGSVALAGTLQALGGRAVFANGLAHTVVVSAVDSNYYQYYRTNSDPFTGATVIGNLAGAEGVFGSIVELVVLDLQVAASSR